MNERKKSPEKTQDPDNLVIPNGHSYFPTAGNSLQPHGKAAEKSQDGNLPTII